MNWNMHGSETLHGGEAYAFAMSNDTTELQYLLWGTSLNIGASDRESQLASIVSGYNGYHSQIGGGYQCQDLTDYANLKIDVDYEKKEWKITNYKISYVYYRGGQDEFISGISGMTVKDQNGNAISDARIYSCGSQTAKRNNGYEIGKDSVYAYPMDGEEFYVVVPYEGHEDLKNITIDYEFTYQSDYEAVFSVWNPIRIEQDTDENGNPITRKFGGNQRLLKLERVGPVWSTETLTIGRTEPTWSFEIKKVDDVTNAVIPNAVFDIDIIIGGKVVETRTLQSDENGRILIPGLRYSGEVTFRITETKPAEGYAYPANKTVEIVVNKEEGMEGKITKVSYNNISNENVVLDSTRGAQKVQATITNHPENFFELLKIAQDTKDVLSDVTFKISIYKDGNKLSTISKKTDGYGIIAISYTEMKKMLGDADLAGDYQFEIEETVPAGGYKKLDDSYIIEARIDGTDGHYSMSKLKIKDSAGKATKMLYETDPIDASGLISITAENELDGDDFRLNIIKQSTSGKKLSGGKFNITIEDEEGKIWYQRNNIKIDGNKVIKESEIKKYCKNSGYDYEDMRESMKGKTFTLTIKEVTPPSGYHIISGDNTFKVNFEITRNNKITFDKEDRDDLIVEKMKNNIGLTIKIENERDSGDRNEDNPYTITISKLIEGKDSAQEPGVTFDITLVSSSGKTLETWSKKTTNSHGKIHLTGLTYTGDNLKLKIKEHAKDGVTPADGIYEREITFSAICQTKTVGRKTTYTYKITDYSESYLAVDITKEDSQDMTITLRNSGEIDNFKMDIAGVVFLDRVEGKDGSVTGLYDGDEVMPDVEATLYYADDNGNRLNKVTDQSGVQNPVRTDINGNYAFRQVDSMKKYIVGFTYNGQDYSNTNYFKDTTYQVATDINRVLNKEEGAYNTLKWEQYSKAQESDRSELNKRFEMIGAYPESYTIGKDLGYNLGDKNVAYSDEAIKSMYEKISTQIRQEGKYTTEEINAAILDMTPAEEKLEAQRMLQYIEDCKISAYTDVYPAFNQFSISDQNNGIPTVDTSTGKETEEIYIALYEGQNQINFGLKARPNIDLELLEDVKNITVTNNQKSTIYDYDQFLSNKLGVHEEDISVAEYTQITSAEDFFSAKDLEESKGLNIFVKFKFRIENTDESYAKIKQLINHYDSRYYEYMGDTYTYYDENNNLVSADTAYIGDSDGNVVAKASVEKLDTTTTIADNGVTYKQLVITLPEDKAKVLQTGGEDEYVYLVLKLTEEGIKQEGSTSSALLEYFGENAVAGKTGERLANFTEIYAYTTNCIPNGVDAKLYKGLVDQDSIAGNFVPGTEGEDDDSVSPNMVYKIKEQRTLSGNVFEDKTVVDASKITDSSKQDGNPGIKNIKVELIELVSDGQGNLIEQSAKRYNEQGQNITNQEVRTDENGYYQFKGYIPGNYVVKFTYGDEDQLKIDGTYNGQDYQSTKANPDTDKVRYWYAEFDENNKYVMDSSNTIASNPTRYSDAYDEVNARKNSIHYVRKESMNGSSGITINNSKAEVLKGESAYTALAEEQTMTAYTSTLELEVEMAQKNQSYNGEKMYHIENIDFGLVKRAPSVVTVQKDIQHITITQSDNTILLDTDVTIGTNGTITFAQNSDKVHLQYIGTKNAYGTGAAKLEIDDEIIIGSIDITYNITVTDESPDTTITYYKDGSRKDIAIGYYKENGAELVYYENSGDILYHDTDESTKQVTSNYISIDESKTEENLVVNKVDNIIDYVSNNLRFDPTKNAGMWNLVTEDVINKQLITGDGNALLDDSVEASFNQYNQKVLATDSNPLLRCLTDSGDEEDSNKAPKSCTITLSATNTQDVDLDYYNAVEILQLDNTAGRVDTESTPGNLDPINDYLVTCTEKNNKGYYDYTENRYTTGSQPSNGERYELDSTKSQYVVITDATGETHYYYVLIGSMLVIFATGIVLIKKFVLNKKIK